MCLFCESSLNCPLGRLLVNFLSFKLTLCMGSYLCSRKKKNHLCGEVVLGRGIGASRPTSKDRGVVTLGLRSTGARSVTSWLNAVALWSPLDFSLGRFLVNFLSVNLTVCVVLAFVREKKKTDVEIKTHRVK